MHERAVDRLTEAYENGGQAAFAAPPPVPVPDVPERPSIPLPESDVDIVHLTQGWAMLAGFRVKLDQDTSTEITKLVAKAIESEAERNLNEWRERFSLQQEG